ncbi:hypothetical protein FACS1894217_15190 [Clostridia bacterium]|nr:hypothetical protein FACS1894217_15190 [Clostridia bacterium]
MRFAKHEQIVNADGELKDVFTVCVDKNSYNANGGEEIFRTQIECDEMYFWNLTHSKNETNRDKSLCDIAKYVMRDL